MERDNPTAEALSRAIQGVREEVGDPLASVVVISPLFLNGSLARQGLGAVGPQIRIHFSTPDDIARQLALPILATQELSLGTAQQTSAILRVILPELAATGALDPYQDALVRKGWKPALQTAIQELESAGFTPDDLLQSIDTSPEGIRARLIHTIWTELNRQRRALNIATPLQTAQAAGTALDQPDLPVNRFEAAVVFGDRTLSNWVFQTFSSWCRRRPTAFVELQPLCNLDPAPRGLRVATPNARIYTSSTPANGLGHLRKCLFKVTTEAATPDDTVIFARTPDDVRECDEAVRMVQEAIFNGTPLERIAVVAPDTNEREALIGAFERAGIPYASFLGAPLSAAAPAKFLIHALNIAHGKHGAQQWYELLNKSGIRWREHLGDPPYHRGRWRKILSRCGAYSDGHRISLAVDTFAQTLQDPADLRAAGTLKIAIDVIQASLTQFNTLQTFQEHAQRWAEFLKAWWIPERARFQVEDVLRRIASTAVDTHVPLEMALAELTDALEEADSDRTSLAAKAVRIFPPMAPLGGDFQLVCVLGLQEGRFPKKRAPDAVLTDDFVDFLQRATGKTLERTPEVIEARRFASIIAAATQKLWLSMPAFEGLAERPQSPSSFALNVATALLGRRVTYRDVSKLTTRFGSLARPYPDNPSRSLGALEHALATVKSSDSADPVLAHPIARQVLKLHLDLDQHRTKTIQGKTTPIPQHCLLTATDFAALDGTPLSAWDLANLLKNPGAFFFTHILGARRPDRLHERWDPLGWWLNTTITQALRHAADSDEPLESAFNQEWQNALDDVASKNGIAPTLDHVVRAMGQRTFVLTTMMVGESFGAPLPELAAVQPLTELPWHIAGSFGRHESDQWLALDSVINKSPHHTSWLAAYLQAQGYNTTGPTTPIEAMRMIAVGGTEATHTLAKLDELVPSLVATSNLVRAGFWPWNDTRFALDSEFSQPLTADLLVLLQQQADRGHE
jgi:hypothetical protein